MKFSEAFFDELSKLAQVPKLPGSNIKPWTPIKPGDQPIRQTGTGIPVGQLPSNRPHGVTAAAWRRLSGKPGGPPLGA